MSHRKNRRIQLASRPVTGATAADFRPTDLVMVDGDVPAPGPGEVLVRNILFSVDPFQRTLMGNTPSETAALSVGDVMRGATVGIVEESRNPTFVEGDHVNGWLGWQDYAVSNGLGVRKIDPTTAPVSTALGVLGHTGLTAWLGSSELVEPKPGGTFVVTNAAGAVGSLAVQIARLKGHRVIGIAGDDEKTDFLREVLGADEAVNYRSKTFDVDLRRALPNGIDRLLDSVGAELFETLMPYFSNDAVTITIGQMAQFRTGDSMRADRLPELLNLILYRRLSIKGMQLTDHFNKYPEFLAEITPLVADGTIKYREDFIDGFDKLPESLPRLFDGTNRGKLIVRAD